MAFAPPVLISCNNEAWKEPRSAWQVGSLGHRVIRGFLEDEALALGVSEEFCEREQGTWRCESHIPSCLPWKGSEFGRLWEPWEMSDLWQVGDTIQSAV